MVQVIGYVRWGGLAKEIVSFRRVLSGAVPAGLRVPYERLPRTYVLGYSCAALRAGWEAVPSQKGPPEFFPAYSVENHGRREWVGSIGVLRLLAVLVARDDS